MILLPALAEWLVPAIVIPAIVALLVAFGLPALKAWRERRRKVVDEAATVSVAKISAETALITMMLQRIQGLEKLGDERDAQNQRREERSQRREERIANLEDEVAKFRDESERCKKELAALTKKVNGLSLKEEIHQ